MTVQRHRHVDGRQHQNHQQEKQRERVRPEHRVDKAEDKTKNMYQRQPPALRRVDLNDNVRRLKITM
jgi:hypothetical protein